MSSHRKAYGLHGGSRLVPQGVISDFPIPNCSECKAPMVKLEGQWGCKNCTKIRRIEGFKVVEVDGEKGLEPVEAKVPLGEAYPNRAARRRARRR